MKQIRKQVGKLLRLRPEPLRRDADGTSLETIDDFWRLDEVVQDPRGVKLHNVSTGHSILLQTDNVREFRSPDFLILHCQLTLTPRGVEFEPILTPVKSATNATRLSGTPADLLRLCVACEIGELFSRVHADHAIAELKITSSEFRDAAKELEALMLVHLAGDANSETGIGWLRFEPAYYFDVAPQLSLDFDVRRDLNRLIDCLNQDTQGQRIKVSRLLRATQLPLPRLDLMLRALQELGYVEGRGPGHYDYGSFFDIEITPSGRRLVRGDDDIPF